MEEKILETYVLKMAALRAQSTPSDPLTASVMMYKTVAFLIIVTVLFFLLHEFYKRLYKSGWFYNTSYVA